MSIFHHEQIYRSTELMQQIKTFKVTIGGAGALGANICENLARAGFANLCIIDFDRVEDRNLSTQPYFKADIGALKARTIATHLYRAIGVRVQAETQRLTAQNAHKLLKGSNLVIDAFDNSVGRKDIKDWAAQQKAPCLHAGLAADYSEVIWNEQYRVPSPTNDDVCDYPLARNLVMLTVALTCEVAINFVANKAKNSYTITLADLKISEYV